MILTLSSAYFLCIAYLIQYLMIDYPAFTRKLEIFQLAGRKSSSRRLDAKVPECFTDHRTDRKIRNEVIIHDIEVHDVSAGFEDRLDVLAEAREVCGQY